MSKKSHPVNKTGYAASFPDPVTPPGTEVVPNIHGSTEGVYVAPAPANDMDWMNDEPVGPEPELVEAVASLGDAVAEPLVVTMSKNIHTGKVERSDGK